MMYLIVYTNITDKHEVIVLDGLRLNIGCGLDVHEKWINIDSSVTLKLCNIPVIGTILKKYMQLPNWPSIVRYGDLAKGLAINPDSCKLIFMSHVLEHLCLEDVSVSLDNIHNYLQSGGTFRIIVPDLEVMTAMYLDELRNNTSGSIAGNNFMTSSGLGCQSSKVGIVNRLRYLASNSRHQWLWDVQSLSTLLANHNFNNIRRCGYGDWSDPLFELVENKERHANAICIECSK